MPLLQNVSEALGQSDKTRAEAECNMTKIFDVAVIGGGINGCGCAADAALRGLSVILCEKGDLASQTSSSSSKLIHGGLRYLEQFDFSLVRKALTERQILLEIAPHLVHPLKFILPQQINLRAPWILRIGLFLYDHLSHKNRLPKSCVVTRSQNPNYFKPLIRTIHNGFMYYDCMTDDARLTMANALQAQHHGAEILTHTEVTQARIVNNIWHLTIQTNDDEPRVIKTRSLINAAGPWVETVNHLLQIQNQHKLSLIKGSHIVLQKLYEGDHAYLLQHDDKRIVFTIPYFGYTLVGTTDILFTGDPQVLNISSVETEYLLDLIARYFGEKPTPQQIITSWSGVRPLLLEPNKSASTLTRDYLYHFSTTPAPCVTIYGGKITTYRLLAEKVIDTLSHVFPNMGGSNTNITPLPGAVLDSIALNEYQHQARKTYSWLDETLLNHYLQTYGTRTENILRACHRLNDLGEHFAGMLYQCEVDYLIEEEWATSIDDILWRRTKLGLDFNDNGRQKLALYLSTHQKQTQLGRVDNSTISDVTR